MADSHFDEFINPAQFCQAENPERYHHSQVKKAFCPWCHGRNPDYVKIEVKEEMEQQPGHRRLQETRNGEVIDLTDDDTPPPPPRRLQAAPTSTPSRMPSTVPDVVRNAKRPVKRPTHAAKEIQALQANLSQFVPGLVNLRQGFGETERQAVNARIAAAEPKSDALSEPKPNVPIQVEIFTMQYNTPDNWESTNYSRLIVVINERLTSAELCEYLLTKLRHQAKREIDQEPLKPDLHLWDLSITSPLKSSPTFVMWEEKELLSTALQKNGFYLEKGKKSGSYWSAYFCCRPDPPSNPPPSLSPPAYRFKRSVSTSVPPNPARVKKETRPRVKKERTTSKAKVKRETAGPEEKPTSVYTRSYKRPLSGDQSHINPRRLGPRTRLLASQAQDDGNIEEEGEEEVKEEPHAEDSNIDPDEGDLGLLSDPLALRSDSEVEGFDLWDN
jgi:hypothetical protein